MMLKKAFLNAIHPFVLFVVKISESFVVNVFPWW